MFFAGAGAQSCDFERARKRRQSLRTRGPKTGLWASRDCCIPNLALEVEDLLLLLRRNELGSVPQRKIMRHAIQIDPRENIVFQLLLKVAPDFTFEQVETIIGCANRVCLLNDQLSAFVEPLEGAGNRERQ